MAHHNFIKKRRKRRGDLEAALPAPPPAREVLNHSLLRCRGFSSSLMCCPNLRNSHVCLPDPPRNCPHDCISTNTFLKVSGVFRAVFTWMRLVPQNWAARQPRRRLRESAGVQRRAGGAHRSAASATSRRSGTPDHSLCRTISHPSLNRCTNNCCSIDLYKK